MIRTILLIGNPNVGKSVIFSRLTGVRVISSNYPGTTVEFSKGFMRRGGEVVTVVDLPGTYSLQPSSRGEEVAVSLLKETPVEESVVVNVLDATNLERNLYLTLQLLEQGYRLIVCLNMCDDTAHRGISIDDKKLQELLGVEVVPLCAVTGAGMRHLIEQLEAEPGIKRIPAETSRERWQRIGTLVESVQRLTHRHHTLRERLEDASVRPWSGLLMSLGVVYAAFRTVRFLGESLITYVAEPIFARFYAPFINWLDRFLGGSGFLHHLLIGQRIAGEIDFKQSLGVLTTAPYIEFAMVLPYVIAFYLVLSVLEDSGYLPRLAILLDSLLHRLGLHGFAIIPVLLGFGCNVPGILATRVLESRRERFIAATLISIGVPCVPLQAMIVGLLGSFSGFYVAGVYGVLAAVSLVTGGILNRLMGGYSQEFLMEIPPYRFPPLRMVAGKLFLRLKGFVLEAVPVVLLGVLCVNLMLYLGLFAAASRFFAPLFQGLFGLPPEAAIAFIIGFVRKDVAAGMLLPLGLSVKQLFISTTLLAMTFPCIATFAVFLKELGWRALGLSVLLMCALSAAVGIVLNLFMRG